MCGTPSVTTTSKIHAKSASMVKSELDLLAAPHTNTSILKGEFVEVKPIRDSYSAMLESQILGSDLFYLDPHSSYLTVSAKVTESDGSPLYDTLFDTYFISY